MTSILAKKPLRIIPRLDIKGPNLVKGIHLEGLRVLGEPHAFAKYYYENGADELFFQDVVASLYGRNSMAEIIQKTANEIFIPLTVGGGIRTIDDINNVLRCGADKVAINTAAMGNKEFVRQASEKFGSSTIVVAIEAIRETDGRYLAYTDNGREYTGINALEWSEEVVELGAGELIITSVDREGTGEGLDLTLLEKISDRVGVPVIAHGGVGKINHVIDLFAQTQVDACSIASVLHYNLLQKNKVNRSIISNEGNVEFLKKNIGFKNIDLIEINEIKSALEKHTFFVRN
jgi:imidazole glycerol-phosphate synthase subunit HisF